MSSPDLQNRAAAYRVLAAQNLTEAQRAATPQLRRWFLHLASSYVQMATQIERQVSVPNAPAQAPRTRTR